MKIKGYLIKRIIIDYIGFKTTEILEFRIETEIRFF
jgi:hypothetical protein